MNEACIFVLCSFAQIIRADDIEIRADLDKTVDALLPSVRKIILKNGMDPMKLIDLSENIFPDLVCRNETNNKNLFLRIC